MGKLLEGLKKYFSTTPKEQIEKDWEEVKELNEIDDGGTLEYMLKEYEEEMERNKQLKAF